MSRYPELGDAFSAIHGNLDRLDRRMERLLECRLAHWEEWAEVAAQSGETRDALLQLLDSLHPDRDVAPSPDVPAENRARSLPPHIHALASGASACHAYASGQRSHSGIRCRDA